MNNKHRIIKTEATEHGVSITLENGVVLHIASNPGYFRFGLSGISVPTLWGYTPEMASKSSNIQNCYYTIRD